MRPICPICLILLLGGCARQDNKNTAAANMPAEEKKMIFFPPDAQAQQKDAVPEQQYVTNIVAYKIVVPVRTISQSDDFWKRVDEKAVDVATYDLLYKNGVRVGIAAAAEWEHLKTIFDQNPAMTTPTVFSGSDGSESDTEMKLNVEYQNLFFFDSTGGLVGRTFERCNNLLRMSYMAAPRKHDSVRIQICPIVKALRERLVPVGDVTQRPVQRVRDERLYDLNLEADVPIDSFLVVAPSPEGKWPTSLGNLFLINDAPTGQTETILLYKPVKFRIREVKPNPN